MHNKISFKFLSTSFEAKSYFSIISGVLLGNTLARIATLEAIRIYEISVNIVTTLKPHDLHLIGPLKVNTQSFDPSFNLRFILT